MVVDAADAELVADALFGLGATAVSERDGADGRVGLVADVDPAELVGAGWDVRLLDDDPSLHTAWHDRAVAWRCGERLVVRPVWVEPWTGPGADDLIEVLLDPGSTFGSGSHPTTRGCLTALEPFAPEAATVLDVGCGTGVLGVAALALGAGSLVAIDVDPAAVAATERAVELNGLTGRAAVSATPLQQVGGRFDLVLANLLVPIVEDLGPELVARLADRGTLVVSGLLPEQLDRALVALAPLRVVELRHEQGWVVALLRRADPAG